MIFLLVLSLIGRLFEASNNRPIIYEIYFFMILAVSTPFVFST